VNVLKSNSSVRELRLGDNQLSPADAVQIGSLLRLNTRLQLLDLSNNQIQVMEMGKHHQPINVTGHRLK
jgi:Leucine-rich repeat (LRR) protein